MRLPMAVHPLYRHIGAAIKKCRNERQLTQEELSGQIGISRASLANIETGRQRLLVHQLYRIAGHLGQEIEAMLPNLGDIPEVGELAGVDFPENASLEQQRQLARLIRDAEKATTS